MTRTGFIAGLIGAVACLAASIVPARAAIDAQHLGARYDAASDYIVFRVYSSRATRIELCLYAASYGAPELATYVLAREVGDVWSVTVPVVDLQTGQHLTIVRKNGITQTVPSQVVWAAAKGTKQSHLVGVVFLQPMQV